jgi:hypothetical protein
VILFWDDGKYFDKNVLGGVFLVATPRIDCCSFKVSAVGDVAETTPVDDVVDVVAVATATAAVTVIAENFIIILLYIGTVVVFTIATLSY